MSYSVYLSYDDGVAQVENHEDGGTYVLGGTSDACLNITYNYAKFYYQYLDEKRGLRWLYEKQAKDTLARLQSVIEILGTQRDDDYWKATSGNAGYALATLLSWAQQHPDAVWSGD